MARPRHPDLPRLAERLEALRSEWHGRRLDSDPLEFPHRYDDRADREIVAFLAASLAFGRVSSIKASVEAVLSPLGPRPAAFLDAWDERPIPALSGFVHRWVRGEDVEALLLMVKRARRAHGSLGAVFAAGDDGSADFVAALSAFYERLLLLSSRDGRPSRGLRFLAASPKRGSACKRAHLFLRWMVRSADPDLGLWTGGRFSPARLLLPMDTHVHRISRYLGLTSRRTADLSAAREATSFLSRLSPLDPVGYDWALSRLGILAECVRERTRRHCERCALAPVCRERIGPLSTKGFERVLTT
ncbi:MAG TPA: TIGR02757 family protein [Thermoanaerobaculia bacterium]|nr:TIGR02757 family protein [Thermoanaerobaculia bacterium]